MKASEAPTIRDQDWNRFRSQVIAAITDEEALMQQLGKSLDSEGLTCEVGPRLGLDISTPPIATCLPSWCAPSGPSPASSCGAPAKTRKASSPCCWLSSSLLFVVPHPKMTNHPSAYAPPSDAPQQAYLTIELPPADEAEAARLQQLRRHVQNHAHQVDLRELAPAVRELMGSGYRVGCGSSHIWVLRLGSPARLAIIADQLTTAYREWSASAPLHAVQDEPG
jgi:hypothetical protein